MASRSEQAVVLLTLSGEEFHTCRTLDSQFIAYLEDKTSFSGNLSLVCEKIYTS